MVEPKYPDITVRLSSVDGNAMSILGACRKAMRRAKVSEGEIKAFSDKATNGDVVSTMPLPRLVCHASRCELIC